MLRHALLIGLAAYAAAEVRVRALPNDLVEVVVGATTLVPQDNNTNSDRVVTTRGRWDAKWGAGGFAQGSFADGIDEEGAWHLVDPTTHLSVADLAAFRLRCPPNSAFSRLKDNIILGARYASLLAARQAGAEARTATIVAKRAVLLDTPLREAVEAAVNDTETRRPAPVRVTLHAAIRDRTGGALVYHVASDRATQLTLHMTVPGALEPLLWESTVVVDGVSTPLVDVDFRDDVTAFRISVSLNVEARAVVRLAYRARYLAFDEWPPDVYRGADVPAGFVAYDDAAGDRALAFSNALLVQTPEMDLSMPFNVATLQGTLAALHVGTVLAALVRRSAPIM